MSSISNEFKNEKIIFKCDRHAASISEKLENFYENKEFFDTVLVAGSDCINIRAHAIVLSAMSEYFLEIFRGSLSPSKANVIELKEIDVPALKSILDFMYSGWIEISLENVDCLLRAACVLKMHSLIMGCCDFIVDQLNCSNCLSWFQLANQLRLSSLKDESWNFIFNHFEEITKRKELMQINGIQLNNLLFGKNPYGDFEELVFLTLVDWIDYDRANRKHLAFVLLSKIQYKLLTPKLIIENRKSICETVETYELICSWLQWHLSPETRLMERQQNSKLAIVSDLNCQDLAIQTYHPEDGVWSVEEREINFKKKSGCSRIVMDNKLIIVGGLVSDYVSNSVECLFLNSFKWNRLPPMQHERIDSQLANLDGNLCVFGGRDQDRFYVDIIEIYNFHKRQWRIERPKYLPSQDSKIVAHNAVLYIVDFINGILQSYHLYTGEWTSREIPQEKLINFGCAAVGRFLYVIGGYNLGQRQFKDTVKRYTITNDTWCEVAPLPKGQSLFVSPIVVENKIVVCGGMVFATLFAEYNPVTDEWKSLGELALDDVFVLNSVICTLPVYKK